MDHKKFNIDDILNEGTKKSFQKNPFRNDDPVMEPPTASRPWTNLAAHKNRVAAFLLDIVPINLAIVLSYYLFSDFGEICNDYLAGSSDRYTSMAFFEQLSHIQWFTIFVWIIYGAIMEGSERRATFGKEYMKIQVVNNEGEQLSMGKALVRNASKILSQFIYGLGFLWSFWDSDRQTWHDKIAKTYVIAEEEKKGGFFL